MSKQKKGSENRKLIDRLLPEPTDGRLLGMLATTYEMQSEFFETDFLPTLLGLGAWDDRNWTSRIALEKHLAELEAATVLLDAGPYRGRPRSLRVEVKPVPLKLGRILHAKVVVTVYENKVQLIVGSANLTEPGYRRNREVVAVLSASKKRPGEAALIADAIKGLGNLLSHWTTDSSTDVCQLALQQLADWKVSPAADEQWFVWGGEETPLWKQVLDRWPKGDAVGRITIVSPFWSEETSSGPLTTLISTLKEAGCLATDAEVNLLTEAAPDTQTTYKPKLPESFCKFDAHSIGVNAYALAVDPRVPAEEVGLGEEFTGTRALHAKVVLMEGEKTSLAYLGSANFTNRGWGFPAVRERANIEAGIILRRTDKARTVLNSLLPSTTGAPVPLSGAATGKLAPPDPSPDELPWPSFLREVVLTPSEANANMLELVASLDVSSAVGPWKMTHLTLVEQPEITLLNVTADDARLPCYRLELNEASLARLLREQEVQISWEECSEGRSFPINVAAAARSALPISPASGRPAEQHLIAYYQGRISWEDLFPDPEGDGKVVVSGGLEADEQNGVDTTRIQSYIVREFVEAIKGINDDLKKAAQSPKSCMRLALLGAVSPIALARHIVEAVEKGERTPTATGFQLVEIMGCLNAASSYEAAPLFREDWGKFIDEAISKIQAMLNDLEVKHPQDLSGDFQRYAKAVREHHLTRQEL